MSFSPRRCTSSYSSVLRIARQHNSIRLTVRLLEHKATISLLHLSDLEPIGLRYYGVIQAKPFGTLLIPFHCSSSLENGKESIEEYQGGS